MNKLTITDSTGKTWQRVSKRKARRYYELNKPVVLCPHKMYPFGVWHVGTIHTRSEDVTRSFDRLALESAWYNCNSETGLYLSYYVRT